MKHVPNVLSVMRCLAVLVLALLLLSPSTRVVALVIFVAAALTDWLDGYLARRLNVVSDFGRMIDPIADKLLVAVTLLMLSADGTIAGAHTLAAMLILFREIAISGLREHLSSRGISVPVSMLGKWKATLQMVALATLIAAPLVASHIVGPVGLTALWLAALATVMSGVQYVIRIRSHFS